MRRLHPALCVLSALCVLPALCVLSVMLLLAASPFSLAGTKPAALDAAVVGHHDLGERGHRADVWVHDGFADVGSWGFKHWSPGGAQPSCPGDRQTGVAVLDVRHRAPPTQVALLQQLGGTSAVDTVVNTGRYGVRAGRDLAVAGARTCGASRYDASLFRGVVVWDGRTPRHPWRSAG